MRRWILHVLPYLKKIGATAYTCEIGRRFLFETLPTLTPSAQRRYKRSIRILDAFLQTGNIPKHAKRVAEPPLYGRKNQMCDVGNVACDVQLVDIYVNTVLKCLKVGEKRNVHLLEFA